MKRFVIDLEALGVVDFVAGPSVEIPLTRDQCVAVVLSESIESLTAARAPRARATTHNDDAPDLATRDKPPRRRPSPELTRQRVDRTRAKFAERRSHGLCVNGDGRQAAPGKSLCVQCILAKRQQNPEHRRQEAMIVQVLKRHGPIAPRKIVEHTGLTAANVRLTMGRLRHLGMIQSEGWALTAVVRLLSETPTGAVISRQVPHNGGPRPPVRHAGPDVHKASAPEPTAKPADKTEDVEEAQIARIMKLMRRTTKPQTVEFITLMTDLKSEDLVRRLLYIISYRNGALRSVSKGPGYPAKWEVVPLDQRDKVRDEIRARKHGGGHKKKSK